MKYRVERAGRVYELTVEPSPHGCVVRGPDGTTTHIAIETRLDGSRRAITPWGELEILSARVGPELWADFAGRRLHERVERVRPAGARASEALARGAVVAPMTGKLLRVTARLGEQVRAGQALAVIQAMKMENELLSPIDGVVTEVAVEAPSAIEKGALIVEVSER